MTGFRSDLFHQPTPIQVQPVSDGRIARRALKRSVLVFIPLAPLMGLLAALRAMGMPGESRGRAALAFVIALVTSTAQGFLGYRGYEYAQQIQSGPQRALAAGGNSELESFKAEIESRYGSIKEVVLQGNGFEPYFKMPQDARNYLIRCDRSEVQAQIAFGIELSRDLHFLETRVTRITLPDSQRGELAYQAPPYDARASAETD